MKNERESVKCLIGSGHDSRNACGCGGKSEGKGADAGGEEGKVINIYSWNDEFRQRVEAVYPEVEKLLTMELLQL